MNGYNILNLEDPFALPLRRVHNEAHTGFSFRIHTRSPCSFVSSMMSWLASQSLFIVQIDIVNTDGAPRPPLSSCGFSPGAIILTMILGTILALGAILTAFRRYPATMPLASTCSAAISAASHPPPEDVDAAVLPVQWGVVSSKDGVRHCSFSSKLVAPPMP